MANEANPCPCDIGDRMEYEGQGQEIQIEHVKAYVVKPTVKSDKAVIVINDIYGWQMPNTRYMADMISANGFIAVIPDFFVGKKPWSPANDFQDQSGTLTRNFQEWLKDRQPTKINKEVDAVLKYLREQCGARKIGSVGFCWGGIGVHHLALEYPDIQAGVSVYGIIRDGEDRYHLKSPTLFIFGDKDQVIPLDQVNVLQKRLQEKCSVDFQVKIYPGQTHGFVHRKREDINPADKPFILEGRTDMVKWLQKYM